MNDITLKDFEDLIGRAYDLKRKKEELEAEASAVGEDLTKLHNQILEFMEEYEKTSYKSKHGTVIRAQKFSVKTPKDPDSKAAFFSWLDSKGIKDDILNINSRTLNSMYQAEMESARERGDIDFKIPGIEPATVYFQIQMRK